MKRNSTCLSLIITIALATPSHAQNTAISTDGSASYVSIPAAIVPSSGDFTVEFWAYIPTYNTTGVHEFISQGSAGDAFYIGYDGTTKMINAGDNWANTGVPMPDTAWTHIAITQSGGTANLYVNDVLAATQTGYSISSGGTGLRIGSNYDGSGFLQGAIDELRIWNVVRTPAQLKTSWYSIDPSTAHLLAYYKMNEGSGLVAADATGNATQNGTLVNNPAWTSSPLQNAPNGVSLDGVNDKVFVPNIPAYDLTSGTVELWVRPGSGLTGDGEIIGVRGLDGTRFSFHLSPTRIGMWNGTGFPDLSFSSVADTWYHLAFVVDGAQDTTGVFVNGDYLGQMNQAFGSMTGLPLVMGLSESYNGDNDLFQGSIDDVRLWTTLRTQTEINTDMTTPLAGNETGLLAQFDFNQGNPGGDNTGLITVIDNTSNNNHGTLMGLNLTGSASNFVTHAITPLPVSFSRFTVTGRDNEALLQWQTAQEQNSRDFTIERSPDGAHFLAIGSVPAAGNSTNPHTYSFTDPAPVKGRNYYRLKESDLDNKFMYSDIRLLTLSAAATGQLVWFKTGDKAVEVDYKQGNSELYTVTDATGRLVQQGQLSAGKLYLTRLSAGMYSVVVMTPTGTLKTKVLIQ